LQTIGEACRKTNPEIQDVASALLGDWLTIDAAPVLLDLAKTAPEDKFRVRAMRGYIKVARQFAMSEPERMEMCHKATEACFRPAERKLVIEVLRRYPHIETFKLALNAYQDPELKDDAVAALLIIAPKLTSHVAEVRSALSKVQLNEAKVEIVRAEYGATGALKDVTEIVRKHAGKTQWIVVPTDDFNELFGGDPAPGQDKLLKIQYKLNDVPGEVSLPANSLVVLPVPKEKK
jgi:hypothetical protein